MKKKLLFGIAIIIAAICATNVIENRDQLNTTVDSTLLACNKCDTRNSVCKCGKCGGFLNCRVRYNERTNKTECTYTCKECNHSYKIICRND